MTTHIRDHLILGELEPQRFLDEYWQQAPLLVRSALPHYESPVTAEELAGLALEEEVESRLVRKEADGADAWQLSHGPFAEADFLALPERDWTLLVQAVDLWVPQVQDLLAHFDFLPRWRMDDVMVSYATPNGSVGPHFDRYDVFLLQVSGSRRWQIGSQCGDDEPLVEGSDLRALARFNAEQEFVVEAGDMLYLPPRVSHWGVAETNCMTYSIGFRAPSVVEMLDDLIIAMLARGPEDPNYKADLDYRDPPMQLGMAREQIDPVFVNQARDILSQLLEDDALLQDWFARYMTAPKYPQHVEMTQEERRASVAGTVYVNGAPLIP